MDAVEDALDAQQAELRALLEPLTPAGWARPSRCEGWSVADVVLHLAQTNELAVASASGDFEDAVVDFARFGGAAADSIDAGADLLVARERDRPPAELRARWERSAASLRQVVREGNPHRRVPWVAGELALLTLVTTRLAETWIHTGDVAEALDVTLPPTDQLWHVARLAWRTLPYAFARAGRELGGPVAFELVGPGGAAWCLAEDGPPVTVIRGPALDLCLVAARRVDPADTALRGEGPDAAAVLDLVRTYA